MIFSKKVMFDNFYSKTEEEIILSYNFADGFLTVKDACKEVSKQKQNPLFFNYIFFNQQYYAVSIETTIKEIVISKDFSWYYDKGKLQKFINKDNFKVPYIIEKPRSSHYWMRTIYDDLTEFNNEPLKIIFGKSKSQSLAFNSVILLGIVMFDTLIPVFKLNAIDKYFLEYPPSRTMLWKKGIKKINPFSQEKEQQGNTYPYEQYKKEYIEKNEEQIFHFVDDCRRRTTGYNGFNVGDYLPEDFTYNVLNQSEILKIL